MSDAPELLPCPFCGGKARAIRSKLIRGAYEVQCKNSHINGLIWETAENAIAAWNRRTPSPEVAALIAEARREGWNAAIEAANWLGLTFYDKVPKGSLTSVTILEYREAIRALKETTHD